MRVRLEDKALRTKSSRTQNNPPDESNQTPQRDLGQRGHWILWGQEEKENSKRSTLTQLKWKKHHRINYFIKNQTNKK